MERPHFKTVVISDAHMGSRHSKVKDVTEFLYVVDCERLIMAGDIIDGGRLKH